MAEQCSPERSKVTLSKDFFDFLSYLSYVYEYGRKTRFNNVIVTDIAFTIIMLHHKRDTRVGRKNTSTYILLYNKVICTLINHFLIFN